MSIGLHSLGGKEAQAPLVFFNGGRLFLPTAPALADDDRLRSVDIELGLRRGWTVFGVRPFVEGLVGASAVTQKELPTAIWNDRRPDPGLRSPSATTRSFSPALGLGVGLEIRGPARIGLQLSAGSQWSGAHDLSGPTLPIRAGATWPSEPLAPPHATESAWPVSCVRFATGTSWLRTPHALRDGAAKAMALAAELDIPLGESFALSLLGERTQHDNGTRIVLRQERDAFGNLVNIYSGDDLLSLTTTSVTAGIRTSHRAARVIASVRAGAGWGRTGGFGRTYDSVTGGYIDPNGNFVPLTQTNDVGGGTPRSGFAFSTGAGLEVRMTGPLAVYAEAGVIGLLVRGDDFRQCPCVRDY